MGCESSSAKESGGSPDAAKEFENLAEVAQHPVAVTLMQEWKLFVSAYDDKQTSANAQIVRRDAMQTLRDQPDEVWVAAGTNPVTHASVDQVGKAFLNYVRVQLQGLGWGGDFDYKVAGTPSQGFIKVSAELDVSSAETESPIIRTWSKKIHYCSE